MLLAMSSKPNVWQSRIVGHSRVDPESLVANPHNFRKHPLEQRDALSAAISEVGFVRSVTVNKTTGNLVDGHERVWQALKSEQPLIDVEYVELSEDEERKVLATLDHIGEMATTDSTLLDNLLADIEASSQGFEALIASLADSTLGSEQSGELSDFSPYEGEQADAPVTTCPACGAEF